MAKKSVCAVILIFTFAMAFAAFLPAEPVMADTIPDEKQQAFSQKEKDEECFTVFAREGMIVIEKKNGDTIETNIGTESLRSYDKELLESGIKVSSYEEVLMLLEDFNS